MSEPTALIFDIEKFAVHDGPGIRTNVFMKGCPLHCLWCHNPESQSFRKEVFFSPEKCIGCSWCVVNCPNQCHIIEDGVHTYDRTNCIQCGKCMEQCYSKALEMVGKTMTVSEVMKEVMTDKVFYDNSGGGITLSGGEPLAHFAFTKALLEAAKKEGLHTAVETCGHAPAEHVRELLPLVDLWLWDVKALPEDHKKLTGVDSTLILENLKMIDSEGAAIHLRCPMIPGVNDSTEELLRIAELANTLKGCKRIDLEPYHPLGENKNLRLGNQNTFHSDFAEKSLVETYQNTISSHTNVEVSKP